VPLAPMLLWCKSRLSSDESATKGGPSVATLTSPMPFRLISSDSQLSNLNYKLNLIQFHRKFKVARGTTLLCTTTHCHTRLRFFELCRSVAVGTVNVHGLFKHLNWSPTGTVFKV
jgi:hypothetical protein